MPQSGEITFPLLRPKLIYNLIPDLILLGVSASDRGFLSQSKTASVSEGAAHRISIHTGWADTFSSVFQIDRHCRRPGLESFASLAATLASCRCALTGCEVGRTGRDAYLQQSPIPPRRRRFAFLVEISALPVALP